MIHVTFLDNNSLIIFVFQSNWYLAWFIVAILLINFYLYRFLLRLNLIIIWLINTVSICFNHWIKLDHVMIPQTFGLLSINNLIDLTFLTYFVLFFLRFLLSFLDLILFICGNSFLLLNFIKLFKEINTIINMIQFLALTLNSFLYLRKDLHFLVFFL